MSTEAKFLVEGKPLTWKRAMTRGGVRFTSPEMREYQKHIVRCWQQSRVGAEPWPTDARYEVAIAVVPDSRRRADLDNYIKGFLDALNTHCWDDDSQVDSLRVDRLEPDKEAPCVGVHIRVIT